ncbi:unnamed protein product [Brugia timori]|uniref:Transposase n=1 Tax=Brugia timori TaxID=42155 RepID=A0A0R3Q8F3_9BILA|nr:unnamed protein product [Brugia timori]
MKNQKKSDCNLTTRDQMGEKTMSESHSALFFIIARSPDYRNRFYILQLCCQNDIKIRSRLFALMDSDSVRLTDSSIKFQKSEKVAPAGTSAASKMRILNSKRGRVRIMSKPSFNPKTFFLQILKGNLNNLVIYALNKLI